MAALETDGPFGGDWTGWIGRKTVTRTALDPGPANRMAATLNRPPDLASGAVLPPGWHWLYFHDVVETSLLGEDGHPARGVTMPPVPLPRRMWAAGALDFHLPLRLGQTVTRTSTIADVVGKRGRSGPLFFVTINHDLDVEGALGVRESQTIVYREANTRHAVVDRSSEGALSAADYQRSWRLGPTTLFRYSALTFNGHRIHYDADYARTVEGYPERVVHGPLLATLLMDLARDNGRGDLSAFEYVARAPLFVSQDFHVSGCRDRGADRLWASDPDGRLAMTASATYRQETT